MSIRTTLTDTARRAQNSIARATVREVDDHNLMQQVKYADVWHSETPSDFERWQMAGLTSHPLKQDQEQNSVKGKTSSSSGGGKKGEPDQAGEFNHDQPKGKAAEALMVYVNGQRSHPVAAVIDDRRTRPYDMPEGSVAVYAPDGSEQMHYINADGTYVVSLDSKPYGSNDTKTRFASLRHVTKDMQSRTIQEGSQPTAYKHEGKTVNTEVRCTANRIEFRAGDAVVGYYDKVSETWHFAGKIAEMAFTEKVETTAPKVSNVVSTRFETVGATYLGLDSKDETPPLGETGDIAFKKTYVKLVT